MSEHRILLIEHAAALQESVASYPRILEGRGGPLILPEDLAPSPADQADP